MRSNPAQTDDDRAFDAKAMRWAQQNNSHEFAQLWADHWTRIIRDNQGNSEIPDATLLQWQLIAEQSNAEVKWHANHRPFYNVWPIMHDMIHSVRLSVRWKDVTFPYETMVFSFPKGREPLGLTSAMAWFGTDALDGVALKFGCMAESTAGGNDALLSHGVIPDTSVTIEEWIEEQHQLEASGEITGEVNAGFAAAERAKGQSNRNLFLIKLMVFVSHVAHDDRILNEVLLREDREHAEAMGDNIDDEWLKRKAAKARASGVLGFDVGKSLQREIDEERARNPSLVNPHVRLYHTGPGRGRPEYRVIKAHFRNKNILTRVPTGYWGFESEEEVKAVFAPVDQRCECVYFLRDGEDEIVKIGWTGRHVEDRIADLSTGNIKLRLLGIVRTGNGVEKESEIHAELAAVRVDLNREWFRLTNQEVAEVLERHGGEWLAKPD
jgi:hypothetical protein